MVTVLVYNNKYYGNCMRVTMVTVLLDRAMYALYHRKMASKDTYQAWIHDIDIDIVLYITDNLKYNIHMDI